jgi:hypothetical protein
MAITQFASSSPSTVKLWSDRVLYDFQSDQELLGQMLSSGVAIRKDETSRGAGDRITVSWLRRLENQGIVGMSAATGLEAELNYYTDNLLIDQLRNPVAIPNTQTIGAQRVTYDLNEDVYRTSAEWMKTRGTLGCLNQLAGNTATTISFDGQNYVGNNKLAITGLNEATAPSTGNPIRIVRANALTTDEAVGADTTATMKFTYILDCEKYAEAQRPYIRPLDDKGDGVRYHCYVHTAQWEQLMLDTTSPTQYRDIQLSMINSGRGEGNIPTSIVYSKTRIFKSPYVAQGVNSSTAAQVDNCRRAVFCGKEAIAVAYGQGYNDGGAITPGFMIKSDLTDIENIRRYAIVGIFGIKKLKYDNVDHGVIVISTYSSI